jgi:hypothetical protein
MGTEPKGRPAKLYTAPGGKENFRAPKVFEKNREEAQSSAAPVRRAAPFHARATTSRPTPPIDAVDAL